MPLINGVCIPPICLSRALLVVGAKVMLHATVGGAPMPPRDVTATSQNLLQQGIAALQNAANLSCDGCTCFIIKRFNPGLNIAAPDVTVLENSDTDPNGVVTARKYIVTGATYVLRSIGLCLAPGTKIKVGKNWVPVEEAGGIGGGSSSGGGKKSGGKKKKSKRNVGRRAGTRKPGKRPRR